MAHVPATRHPPLLRMLLAYVTWPRLRRLASAMALYAALWLPLGGLYKYPWQMPGVALRLSYAALVAILEYVARGGRPLFAEWTLPFEIVRAVLRCMITYYSPRVLDVSTARHMRRQGDWAGTVLGAITCRQHGTETQAFQHNGLEHLWVRFPGMNTPPTKPTRRCVLLYYHGGGFSILSPKYYISSASDLLVRTHAKLQALTPNETIHVEVLLANYRKTPEFPYPTPPDDALVMYRYLLDVEHVQPQNIIVSGDSAGACLALTTMLRVRDNDPHDLPCAAILSCPYVDLEMRGDERKVPYCIVADGALDAIPKGYVPWGGSPATWGDASPLHCKLTGLPPVYIITGEFDYILPQAQRLMDRAREDGVAADWQLDVHRHMVHVFMNLPTFILPHAAVGLDAMATYAADKFARANKQASERTTRQAEAFS